MAKQHRDPAKEQFWRGLVSEYQASGLNVREFCSQRQVKEASFYSWRRELQQRDGCGEPRPAFVPVKVAPTLAAVEVPLPVGACRHCAERRRRYAPPTFWYPSGE